MEDKQKLIFIYNARSGAGHQVMDFLHKAVSPATYQCSLCAITYGTFTIKSEWKTFIERLPLPVEFLYKDEVIKRYPRYNMGFPAILLQARDKLLLLIGAKEMVALDLEQLMQLLRERLHQQGVFLFLSP
jgi:hypothetical protein